MEAPFVPTRSGKVGKIFWWRYPFQSKTSNDISGPNPCAQLKAQVAQAPFLILERQFALDFLHSARTKKINGSGPYILFWACSRGVRVEALSLCISYCYHPSNSKVPRIATCLSQTMHPLFFPSWPIFASLCTTNQGIRSSNCGKFRGQVFRAFLPFYLQC